MKVLVYKRLDKIKIEEMEVELREEVTAPFYVAEYEDNKIKECYICGKEKEAKISKNPDFDFEFECLDCGYKAFAKKITPSEERIVKAKEELQKLPLEERVVKAREIFEELGLEF